jgi:hypothetical protein
MQLFWDVHQCIKACVRSTPVVQQVWGPPTCMHAWDPRTNEQEKAHKLVRVRGISGTDKSAPIGRPIISISLNETYGLQQSYTPRSSNLASAEVSIITNQREVFKTDNGKVPSTNNRNKLQMHVFLTKTIQWLSFDIAAPTLLIDRRYLWSPSSASHYFAVALFALLISAIHSKIQSSDKSDRYLRNSLVEEK